MQIGFKIYDNGTFILRTTFNVLCKLEKVQVWNFTFIRGENILNKISYKRVWLCKTSLNNTSCQWNILIFINCWWLHFNISFVDHFWTKQKASEQVLFAKVHLFLFIENRNHTTKDQLWRRFFTERLPKNLINCYNKRS